MGSGASTGLDVQDDVDIVRRAEDARPPVHAVGLRHEPADESAPVRGQHGCQLGHDPRDPDTDDDAVRDGKETYTSEVTRPGLGLSVSMTGRLEAAVSGEKFRILDDYVDDAGLLRANEVKTGDGRLDRRSQTQIDKDAFLVASGDVNGYTPNFFPSGRSDRVGPNPELLTELKLKGLKVKVWLPR